MKFLPVLALASVAFAAPFPQDAATSDVALASTDAGVAPTGTHSHRPHGTGESGHARPTGHHERPSGVAHGSGHRPGHAKPTGHHERPSGVAHGTGKHSHSGKFPEPTALAAEGGQGGVVASTTDAAATPAATDDSTDASDDSLERRQDDGSDDSSDSTDAASDSVPAATSVDAGTLPTGSAVITDAPTHSHHSGFARPTGGFHSHASGHAHPSGEHHQPGHAKPTGHHEKPSGTGKHPHFVLPSGFLSEISGTAVPTEFLPMLTKIRSEMEAHQTAAPVSTSS